MEYPLPLGVLYVHTCVRCSTCLHNSGKSIAFYGVIDLLSVLPYYLEIILLQDTVRQSSFILTFTELSIVHLLPIFYFAHVSFVARIQAIPL